MSLRLATTAVLVTLCVVGYANAVHADLTWITAAWTVLLIVGVYVFGRATANEARR